MGEGRGAISRRPLAEAVQVEGQHFGPVTLVIEACEGAPGNSGVGPSYEDPKALVDSGTLGLLGVWGSEDPEVLVDSGWPWGSLGSGGLKTPRFWWTQGDPGTPRGLGVSEELPSCRIDSPAVWRLGHPSLGPSGGLCPGSGALAEPWAQLAAATGHASSQASWAACVAALG